jgi:hypothetical protein
MAHVVAYQTAHGKRYRVRYRTPDRRQTDKRGFKTKREAQAWANEVEVNKRRGEYVAPSLGRATVGELAKDWLTRNRDSCPRGTYQAANAGYVQRAAHVLPKSGTHRPWNVRHNYVLDAIDHRLDRTEESMVFGRTATEAVRSA